MLFFKFGFSFDIMFSKSVVFDLTIDNGVASLFYNKIKIEAIIL